MFSKLQIGKEQYIEYELYIKYPMLMSVQFSFVTVSFFVLLIQNSGKKKLFKEYILLMLLMLAFVAHYGSYLSF